MVERTMPDVMERLNRTEAEDVAASIAFGESTGDKFAKDHLSKRDMRRAEQLYEGDLADLLQNPDDAANEIAQRIVGPEEDVGEFWEIALRNSSESHLEDVDFLRGFVRGVVNLYATVKATA